jgi:hypothetical protein
MASLKVLGFGSLTENTKLKILFGRDQPGEGTQVR